MNRLLVLLLLTMTSVARPSVPDPAAGAWRAWLDTPGGPLPFGLALERTADGGWSAVIANGDERLAVPDAAFEGGELVLDIAHYDSRVTASLSPSGALLKGSWTKRRGADRWATLGFHAVRGETARFVSDVARPDEPLSGRWRVEFASDDGAFAVGEFDVSPDGTAAGTFLTTTGDYRFLAGRQDGARLRLSCFDGGHAFLFDATRGDDGTLVGDFWSGAHWHDTWTAVRDDDVTLPDAFEQTRWTGGAASLADLAFPDLDGARRSLDDPAFAGRARVLHVFGSWCPNCHDASAEMVRLASTYGERGLSVLGLAFELTGDLERDTRQVRRYAEAHGVTYPILVAGRADKSEATATLGLLDRVRSYPTTIFLHGDGRVHSIHTGFSGPATGARHDALQARYTAIVEELLAGG